jgi:hypothetical protein
VLMQAIGYKVVEILLQKGVDLHAVDNVRDVLCATGYSAVCYTMWCDMYNTAVSVEGKDSANVCSYERSYCYFGAATAEGSGPSCER